MNAIGASLILTGYFMIARLNQYGFIISSLGSLIYIFAFWNIDWSVVALNFIFILINTKGFYDWSMIGKDWSKRRVGF